MPPSFPISAVIVADEIVPDPDVASADDRAKSDRYGDIPWLVDVLIPLCDEIIMVAADPLDYLAYDTLIVRPHSDKQGPLGAVYAGLSAARHQQVLVTHCRMPMVKVSMIGRLIEAAEPRFDAVVATASSSPDLFPVVYHKRCLKILAQLWAKGPVVPLIEAFFQQVRVHAIDDQKGGCP